MFPFPHELVVRTTHQNPSDVLPISVLVLENYGSSRSSMVSFFQLPGIPNPSSKSGCSAPSMWVLVYLTSGFRIAWCCCSGCLVGIVGLQGLIFSGKGSLPIINVSPQLQMSLAKLERRITQIHRDTSGEHFDFSLARFSTPRNSAPTTRGAVVSNY